MYLDIRFYLKCLPFFYLFRSSHWRCCVEVSVLRSFVGFIGKFLCRDLFFNKAAGLWPAAFLKGRLWHMCSFLWVLQDFWEHLFYRAPLNDSFCLFYLWYLANLRVKKKYITRYNLVYNLYIVLCFLCLILELVL